jgi:hypothetical protein
MTTYIESTVQRFNNFDLSKGIPYRELVGSLLWIVLCVLGTELLQVKDLARRSNEYTIDDYNDALKVLDRIVSIKDLGIVFQRGVAGREYVPASSRLGGGLEDVTTVGYSISDSTTLNELEENSLYKLVPIVDDELLDIPKVYWGDNAVYLGICDHDQWRAHPVGVFKADYSSRFDLFRRVRGC